MRQVVVLQAALTLLTGRILLNSVFSTSVTCTLGVLEVWWYTHDPQTPPLGSETKKQCDSSRRLDLAGRVQHVLFATSKNPPIYYEPLIVLGSIVFGLPVQNIHLLAIYFQWYFQYMDHSEWYSRGQIMKNTVFKVLVVQHSPIWHFPLLLGEFLYFNWKLMFCCRCHNSWIILKHSWLYDCNNIQGYSYSSLFILILAFLET